MRELFKSMWSVSWALSLLGIKQSANIINTMYPNQRNWSPSVVAWDRVTNAATDQLDDALKGAFRTGDSLQRGIVDLAFVMLNPAHWNPWRGRH
jgi:hypothetical protein